MKKLLFSLSLLASLATFAGESTVDASAQVFGMLPITSSASDVIVSVPWTSPSNTETNLISVAEIIKTANLTEGDWIRVWNAGTTNNKFKVWNLTRDPNGVLVWEPGTVVDAKGQTASGQSEATFLERGEALILHRQNPGTSAAPNTFYVYGQYKTGVSSVTVAQGTTNTPAYTLVAPPGTTATDLNDTTQVEWSGNLGDPKNGGENIITDVGLYYRKPSLDNKWGTAKGAMPAIEPGKGAWYISRGGAPTITFK